ncbi:hypothetical protein JW926_15545 [Candidatus Sumerlaeota bacterium]|nr:hypothetical protein [Candidatus Sumerlaeota bacterium]
MMDTRTKNNIKLVVSILLVLGSFLFVYGQYRASLPPKPPEGAGILLPNSEQSGQINAPEIQKIFPAEERKQMREEIYGKLELSLGQREKMEKIAEKYDGQFTPGALEARMKEWKEALTPEQWQKGQEMRGAIVKNVSDRIRSRIMQRAAILPESERRKFEEKLDQRIQERQARVENRLNEINSRIQGTSEEKK